MPPEQPYAFGPPIFARANSSTTRAAVVRDIMAVIIALAFASLLALGPQESSAEPDAVPRSG
jgi:hypothetical protein